MSSLCNKGHSHFDEEAAGACNAMEAKMGWFCSNPKECACGPDGTNPRGCVFFGGTMLLSPSGSVFKPATLNAKDNPPNPKQRYGDLKVPVALVPPSAIIAMGTAFKEGARKYGAYNWRDKAVESMTYINAAQRHILAYLDGEEIDPESGNTHMAHALACLAIIVDATAIGALVDNRPLKGTAGVDLRSFASHIPEIPTAPAE